MNNLNIHGKKILLLIPLFHEYTELISGTLKKMGADVIFIENKHFFWDYRVKTTFLRSWRKIVFKLTRPDLKYFEKEIKPAITNAANIDYLFCIDCDSLSKPVFDLMDSLHPNAKKILYMWDSLTIYEYDDFIKYFNKVYTFDHYDAKTHGINYLPNFVVPTLDETYDDKQYDIYFIGKQYGKRFQIIKKVYDEAIGKGLKVFIKLYVHLKKNLFLKYFYKIFRYFRSIKSIEVFCLNYEIENGIITYPFVTHDKISLSQSLENLRRSKCIVDICFESQTGSSHRVMQALYYKLKVITNNGLIIHEEFYSADRIKIINLAEPEFDTGWINAPVVFDQNLMRKYEIDNWLTAIFS